MVFSLYVGTLAEPTRTAAEELHAKLGAAAPDSVLLAVSPGQRVLHIVTGQNAAVRVPEPGLRLGRTDDAGLLFGRRRDRWRGQRFAHAGRLGRRRLTSQLPEFGYEHPGTTWAPAAGARRPPTQLSRRLLCVAIKARTTSARPSLTSRRSGEGMSPPARKASAAATVSSLTVEDQPGEQPDHDVLREFAAASFPQLQAGNQSSGA